MAFTAESLGAYADLIVRIGVNLREGQRLLVIGPLAYGGVSLEAAPLVRAIAVSAYRAGAPLVETLWGDEELLMARFRHSPAASLSVFSDWLPRALVEHVDRGHAVLSVYANDPDHLKDEGSERITALQQATSRAVREFREQLSRNHTNWTVVAAAGERWAAKVFADAPADQQVPRLWDAIARMCRLDRPDPIAAWETHLADLAARRDELNGRRFTALKYRAPGTDLTIGLPEGHTWVSGRSSSRAGGEFAPNLPTEEVFTIAHKDRVDGTVRATKPLSYGGTLIEGFDLRFERGRVVQVSAARGEGILRQLVSTDDGAGRLGEVALVPHSSPISQTGRLFYNTLFDENAASHVALGSAYKFTIEGGESMDDDTFARGGGNRSAVHVDFMIGSGELDVDGVVDGGAIEPVMRGGEWCRR